MKKNYCTVEFCDGRIYQAKVGESYGGIGPVEILIDGEWIDFEEFQEEDDQNSCYGCENYREHFETEDSIPASVYDELFNHMSEEHGIELLADQMQDIVNICAEIIVQQDYIENELPGIEAGFTN